MYKKRDVFQHETGDYHCRFFPFGSNVEENIEAVVEAGFGYIDYSFSYDYRTGSGLLGDRPETFAKKLLKMADEKAFRFVQAHSPLGRPFAEAEDVKELADFIDHPRLKICRDIGHGNLQELPQHEALALIKDRLAALHVQGNFGLSDDHVIPFTGTVNMESVMNGLLDIKNRGNCSHLEFNSWQSSATANIL